ncbi:MAG: hypothetical protein ACKO91_10600 [Acidimicrobiales bacterium]
MASPAGSLRVRILLAEAAAVALATTVAVGAHLQVWRARWSVPWVAEGDASFYLMVARALGQGDGYLTNDHLGFPFGQRLHDLPQGFDNANWLLLRILAAVTGSPGAAVNAFYLVTFPMVAAVACVALRRLGLGRATAMVGAVLYAVAPYHFARNEVHLLLSSYALVPVSVLLALALFDDLPPWRDRRWWWVVAGLVGLASTGAYYLAFTLLLVAVAGVVAALERRQWQPVLAAGAMIAVAGVAFALNVSPSLVELTGSGANPGVAGRTPGETELYGLRVSQLYAPRLGHRVDALATLAAEARGTVVPSEEGQALGLVGAAGLSMLFVVFVVAIAGRGVEARLRRLALLAVVSILVATVSGFSYLLSAAGLTGIRSWNRISVLVAFVALAAVLVVVERLAGRLAARRGWPVGTVTAVAALAVGSVGWLDQTAPADVPPYAAAAARWSNDASFFADVRARIGDGAGVLVAPHLPFPEMPNRLDIGPYDGALGYVHAPTLRWTWGFMRGRHPDWPCALASMPAAEQAARVRAVGIAGVVVDRRGDRVPGEVEAPWRSVLGEPSTQSADGRYAFYDLRSISPPADAEVLAAATLALEPPGGSDGCYGT